MSNKRNRWLTILVMSVGALAFIGFSVVLPFSGAFQQSQRSGSASPSPKASASPTSDLEAQAKGYEMVLQREPDNQTALQGLVETRIQQGKLDALLEPLQKLAELNPEQPDYAVLLAQTKQRLGDPEAAAELYRSTLEKHPGSINALKGLADLLLQQERPEAAISLLQDTIKTADEANKAQPGTIDVASIQLLLGETYARQDRFEEAMAIYDQASQTNAQDFRPILGKALVLKAQGNLDQAQPLFASAAALAPAQFKDQITQLGTASPSPSPSATAENQDSEAGSEAKSQEESEEKLEETAPIEAAPLDLPAESPEAPQPE